MFSRPITTIGLDIFAKNEEREDKVDAILEGTSEVHHP